MNGKVSKLLRNAAQPTGIPYEQLKAWWLATPRSKRNGFRKRLELAMPFGEKNDGS